MCQELGITEENEFIPKVASAFGGGLGNTGSVCGSVIGAGMAIGLKLGGTESMEGYLEMAGVVQEFRRRFEAEMETIECRELTGMPMQTPEEIEAYMKSDAPMMVCFPAVSFAYQTALDVLKERDEATSA